MSVRIYLAEDILTAHLEGELDHHAARDIRAEIDEAAERAHPSLLVLDFRDVTFMDSSGIGLVMGRYSLMQEMGGLLRIENLPSHIKKVMKLAGLERLTSIEAGGIKHEAVQ